MAIGGAFLGGGVELVPAGSCKLELEAYTDDATVSATFTITGGGNTYSITSGTDGRASKVVPSGVTYTVSATVTGYTAPPSQTVIAESSSIKYVRFDAQLKKAQGDISTLQADVDKAEGDISTLKTDVGNAQGDISTLQADVKRAQSTADSKADTTVATQSANGLMSKDDKIKLDGIENTYATITDVQTAQSTADGKVSKSGDTMTGTLITEMNLPQIYFTNITDDFTVPATEVNTTHYLAYLDKNGQDTFHISEYKYNYGRGLAITLRNKTTGEVKEANLGLTVEDSGAFYVTAPSWSPGTNDNSDKILTIKMANSLPSLVHTTGNETIAGIKSFLDPVYVKNNLITIDQSQDSTTWTYVRGIEFRVANDQRFGEVRTCRYTNTEGSLVNSIELITMGKDKIDTLLAVVSADNGKKYAIAPTTPTNATSNEIATADWSISKFQRKITYGTGEPPSGGQAGDIYIKI